MLNGFLNSNFDLSDIKSMISGHHQFMKTNKGRTDNPRLQHYVTNPEYVLSNNRHFIADNQMEAQPNGDATTEGQSLQIIGYCYAYLATGESEYLEAARGYFDAYIDHFYFGQPIPEEPSRYICNWIINGKESVLSNWPIDFDNPTHSGFKGVMLNYSNGRTQIPHGAPLWGEYLDKFTFAFDGGLGWDSIIADVYALKDDGVTIDWSKKGLQYDVDWVVNFTGKKINWNGDVLEEHASEPIGTVQLKNTSVNGQHKSNWGNRQPVEHGGFLIPRNHPWHNRPLHVPVATNGSDGKPRYEQMGNASDAEQWFADAAYLLYKITGESKYYNTWQSVLVTTHEYANIDNADKFFRQEVSAETPWTDGISYDFQYPDTLNVNYSRDNEGYIVVSVDGEGQNSMEQQSVWYKVNQDSQVLTTISGATSGGKELNATVEISMAETRRDPESSWSKWTAQVPVTPGSTPVGQPVPMKNFLQLEDSSGKAFVTADERMIVNYGSASTTMRYEDNVFDSRSAYVADTINFSSGSGHIIGFWLLDSDRLMPTSIVIRTNAPFRAHVTDGYGWRWGWDIGNTGNSWQRVFLGPPTLNSYQPNEDMPDGWDPRPPPVGNGPWAPPPRPTNPTFNPAGVEQMELRAVDNNAAAEVSWYCINDLPASYNGGEGYIMKYRLTLRGKEAYTYYLGNCEVLDALPSGLFCTPGVIPFSNIYTEGTKQFDGWHGMPYPGYQHPFIYAYDNDTTRLYNMIEFMYQSQVAYTQKFGIVGPGMSAYIWDRWDNYKYGPPDTWTMHHWGDGTAWSGYQPRAYFSAARVWYELVIQGKPIPDKLKIYVDNWTSYLCKFMEDYGVSPTDFPMETIPKPIPNDFTGHMCGLWLAGACISALSGSTNEKLPHLIEMLAKELNDNYKITDVPLHVMNGSWTPALRLDSGSGPESNGMFFGFWSGEILRGLGLYALYKKLNVGENMYELNKEG